MDDVKNWHERNNLPNGTYHDSFNTFPYKLKTIFIFAFEKIAPSINYRIFSKQIKTNVTPASNYILYKKNFEQNYTELCADNGILLPIHYPSLHIVHTGSINAWPY